MSLATLEKGLLLVQLLEKVGTDLAVITRSQQATAKGATHEESRAENDKDTRATESSYLARGQAERVMELRDAVIQLQALHLRNYSGEQQVAVTALVSLESEAGESRYFLLPVAGGYELELHGMRVKTVTTKSPLGRAIAGKSLGDDVEFDSPQGKREYSLIDLA